MGRDLVVNKVDRRVLLLRMPNLIGKFISFVKTMISLAVDSLF
jgi:hypothetical protein